MTLNLEKIIYPLVYTFVLIAILVSVFAMDILIFVKPWVIIMLSMLYVIKKKNANYLVLFTMALIMVAEVLSFTDFTKYFLAMNVLLSVYYILNVILLRKSLLIIKIRLKKVFTVQLLITMSLIIYVLYSVTDIIFPLVKESQQYLIILVICFVVFLGCCYYIYLNSKTVVSSSLMVAASCFLIVNILTALHELYISLEVFPVIMNFLQTFGQLFLIKFFIEQNDLVPSTDDYF